MTDAATITHGSWRELLGPKNLGASTVLAGGVALYATNEFLTISLLPSTVADIGGQQFYAWVITVYLVGSVVSYSMLARRLGGLETAASVRFLSGMLAQLIVGCLGARRLFWFSAAPLIAYLLIVLDPLVLRWAIALLVLSLVSMLMSGWRACAPPPVKAKRRSFCSGTAIRASGVFAAAGICRTSTLLRASRSLGVPVTD